MIVGSSGTQPGRWCISSRMWLSGRVNRRALPELLVAFADEGAVEDDAGDDRAGGEHEQRQQHHERALMGRVVAVMAVLMLGMGRRLDVVTVCVVLDALVLAMRVLVVMAVAPARRSLEGEEEQTPGVERGHEGRDNRRQEGEGAGRANGPHRPPR